MVTRTSTAPRASHAAALERVGDADAEGHDQLGGARGEAEAIDDGPPRLGQGEQHIAAVAEREVRRDRR
jgi:hypothetical protein